MDKTTNSQVFVFWDYGNCGMRLVFLTLPVLIYFGVKTMKRIRRKALDMMLPNKSSKWLESMVLL
jgi:hypothetical protein